MKPFKTALAALFLSGPALAGDCEVAYDMDGLFGDLDASEEALRSMNYAGANASASAMRDGLGCLEQIMPVVIAGRAYRAIGAGLSLGGDDDGEKWFRTAADIDPTFEYGLEDLPESHPVRSMWRLAQSEGGAEAVEVEGVQLTEGKHFVDGRRINFPLATVDRFHTYQLVHDGVRSWVMDGNTFPDAAFGKEVLDTPEPEPEVVPDPISSITEAQVIQQKHWPAERVFLVVGGGLALAGSGAMYGLSASSRSSFDTSTTVADMDKYKGQANGFFVGSGAAAAVGAGSLVFGALFFVIDGDPRPTLDIRF